MGILCSLFKATPLHSICIFYTYIVIYVCVYTHTCIYIPSSLNSYSLFTTYLLLQRLHDVSEWVLGSSPLKLFWDFGKAILVYGFHFLCFQKIEKAVHPMDRKRKMPVPPLISSGTSDRLFDPCRFYFPRPQSRANTACLRSVRIHRDNRPKPTRFHKGQLFLLC